MTKLDEKIKDEYANFVEIYKRLNYIPFFENKELRVKMYRSLQNLVENRILYRYKIKSPPYHGYNPITEGETTVDSFFNWMKTHMESKEKTESELYKSLDKIKNYFLDLVNNKEKKFSYIYKSNDNDIIVTDSTVKYRKITIELDDRLRYLLAKMKKKRFMRMILRYLGYGITGHHCSIPYNVYHYFYKSFGVRGEGFSSPLNSKLIELPDTVFCTLFKDTDKYAGSLGPFSHKVLVKHSDVNWTLNPPYMADVMYMVYKEVMKAFKKIERQDFLVICLFPRWPDDEAYIKMSKSKYLARLVEPPEGRHYMNCSGTNVYMKGVINSAFFLCRDKSVVTDEKINEMLSLWDTFTEGNIQQSLFSKPIKN
jgi:hypothetical protein